jgi:hypothetical protein
MNIPVFGRSRNKRSAEQTAQNLINNETPITRRLPSNPLFDENQSFGADVNLGNIIREHAPKRLASIAKEIKTFEQKMHTLNIEADELKAMLDSLKPPLTFTK